MHLKFLLHFWNQGFLETLYPKELFVDWFHFLSALIGGYLEIQKRLPFQKIIVTMTPHGEEWGSRSLPFKNAVSVAALLYFKVAANLGT